MSRQINSLQDIKETEESSNRVVTVPSSIIVGGGNLAHSHVHSHAPAHSHNHNVGNTHSLPNAHSHGHGHSHEKPKGNMVQSTFNFGMNPKQSSDRNVSNPDLLQESLSRICLLAMENERLFNKVSKVQQDLTEKTRELEIYKGRCESLEKSRQFDSVSEEKLLQLRQERDKLDSSLREANREVEGLKNKVFDFDLKKANNQSLESELRRLQKEKYDVDTRLEDQTKAYTSLEAQLEGLTSEFNNEHIYNNDRVRTLEEKLRMIEGERDMMKDVLNRKEESDKRWRDSQQDLENYKNQLFMKDDQLLNLYREKDDLERHKNFLEAENDKNSFVLRFHIHLFHYTNPCP